MSAVVGSLLGIGPAPFAETHYIYCGVGVTVGPPVYVSSGFSSTFNPVMGTMTNPYLGLKSNAQITNLYCLDDATIYFILNGSQTNAGWTSMTFSSTGLNLTRAAAGYTNYTSYTQWTWSVAANPLIGSETVMVGFN